MYSILFPTDKLRKEFDAFLGKIPLPSIRNKVIKVLQSLQTNPVPIYDKNLKTLVHHELSDYRYRVNDYRIFFDVDHEAKIVWIFQIKKRDERTY